MPKAQSLSNKRRHNPLEHDLVATGVLKNSNGRPSKRANKGQAEEPSFVDAKASRKILDMSRDLLQEEDQLQEDLDAQSAPTTSAFDFDPSRLDTGSDEEEGYNNEEEAWGDEDEEVEEIEVDADDLETFNRYITPSMNDDPLLAHGWDLKGDSDAQQQGQGQGTNLADLILAKIAEKEAAGQGGWNDHRNGVEEDYELPPKVIDVFEKYVGLWDSPVNA